MKRLLIALLSIVLGTTIFSSCNNDEYDSNSDEYVESLDSEETNLDEIGSSQISEESLTDELPQKSFYGDIIINNPESSEKQTYILLKNDGTVIAKGFNEFGQLGNGQRIDSSEWITIDSLNDIKQIANFNEGFNMALSNDGDLYYWGCNILTPIKLEIPFKIEKIAFELGESIIKTTNGEYYYLSSDDKLYGMDKVKTSLEKLFMYKIKDESGLTCISYRYHAKIVNSQLYIYKDDALTDLVYKSKSKDIVSFTMDDFSGISSKSGRKIYSCISSEGSIIAICLPYDHYEIIKNEITEDDLGGKGYKRYYYTYDDYHMYNEYALFYSGTIDVRGRNDKGQLGDGTDYDYFDDNLKIDIPLANDLYVYDNKTVFVITEDNTIYAWGLGYGKDQDVIINNYEWTL